MMQCWKEEPTRRPRYEDIIDDLEGQISEVSGIVSRESLVLFFFSFSLVFLFVTRIKYNHTSSEFRLN